MTIAGGEGAENPMGIWTLGCRNVGCMEMAFKTSFGQFLMMKSNLCVNNP